MANRMRQAMLRLGERMKSRVGVSITVTRGGTTSAPLTAWVDRTVFVSNQQNQARVEFGERDYLIMVADYPHAEPDEGDRINETIEGLPLSFRLMAPNNEPPWRYSDAQRTTYRVHCKRVV